jgi:hypothetical protein
MGYAKATIQATITALNSPTRLALQARVNGVQPHSVTKAARAKLVRLGLVKDVESLELTAYGRAVGKELNARLAKQLTETRAAAVKAAEGRPLRKPKVTFYGWSEGALDHP